jgi:hypothetical protein
VSENENCQSGDNDSILLLSDLGAMSDDSSSEDEITKRILKDSIDTDLLTNDLYSNSPSKKQSDKIKSEHIFCFLN